MYFQVSYPNLPTFYLRAEDLYSPSVNAAAAAAAAITGTFPPDYYQYIYPRPLT